MTAVITGRREGLGWANDTENVDFFDLKGVAEQILGRLGIEDVIWVADSGEPYLHPGKSAHLKSGEVLLGTIGEIHPLVSRNYDLEQNGYLLDLDVEALLGLQQSGTKFEQLSRFPDVFRDTAILVDDATTAEEVLKIVQKGSAKFVDDVVLFDLYKGKGVPDGKKSIAFRVRYRSAEKTFTDEEINKAHNKIISLLGREIGAEVR